MNAECSGRVSWGQRTALFALLCLLFFGFNWIRPLSHPDEGRYVRIPQEMVERGNYVTPQLNGVDYFYKPPLFYWLQTIPLRISGTAEAGLRFFPALAALITCLAVVAAGRRLWDEWTGWLAALVLATAGLFYGMSQIVILDMLLTACISVALLCYLGGIDLPEGRRRKALFALFYLSLGLAVMTKGLIGLVIPAAVIGLWTICLWRWKDVLRVYLLPGMLLFLAVVVPWHALATLENPATNGRFFSSDPSGQGFAWFYFWHEHVLRYIDPGSAERSKPWWFFLAVTPLGLLPWAVFLPGCAAALARGRRFLEPPLLFLIVWALFPVVFFSLSSSKLPPYVLPSMPALALLLAWYGRQLRRNPGAMAIPLYILSAVAMIAAVVAPIVIEQRERIPDGITPVLIVVGLILFCGGFLTLLFTLRDRFRAAGATALVTAALFCCCFNPMARFLQRPSTKAFAEWVHRNGLTDAAIYTVFDYYQDFPVYLGRSIAVAENTPKEQTFGRMRGDHEDRYVTAAQLNRHLESDEPVLILIEVRYLDYFYGLVSPSLLYEYQRDDFFLLAGNRSLP